MSKEGRDGDLGSPGTKVRCSSGRGGRTRRRRRGGVGVLLSAWEDAVQHIYIYMYRYCQLLLHMPTPNTPTPTTPQHQGDEMLDADSGARSVSWIVRW